jgi:hypothetical protein
VSSYSSCKRKFRSEYDFSSARLGDERNGENTPEQCDPLITWQPRCQSQRFGQESFRLIFQGVIDSSLANGIAKERVLRKMTLSELILPHGSSDGLTRMASQLPIGAYHPVWRTESFYSACNAF